MTTFTTKFKLIYIYVDEKFRALLFLQNLVRLTPNPAPKWTGAVSQCQTTQDIFTGLTRLDHRDYDEKNLIPLPWVDGPWGSF